MDTKEVSLYIFFGVLTTAINYIVYVFAILLLSLPCLTANTIAWIVAVIFAFITNKHYVFASKSRDAPRVLKELGEFVAARLLSVLVETAILFLFVLQLGWNEFLVKLVANAIVIILNYLASKWIIFRSQ
ncbi:MAG: GtrA family protein [Desulfovibrionaceae bacterium]|nr:GtrA family protein [Desulfovibrionaceae bacterium]